MADAMITVKTISFDGLGKNETEIMTGGTFEKIPHGYEIKYDDTDATGFEGSTTSVKILNGSRIEMLRSGDYLSELCIERGKKNFSLYGTPGGELSIAIDGKDVSSMLTDAGGNVTARYTLSINSNLIGDFSVNIDVKCRSARNIPLNSEKLIKPIPSPKAENQAWKSKWLS